MIYRYAVGMIALSLLFSNPLFAASMNYRGYAFEAQVLKANGKRYKEFVENTQAMLKVKPNEEYSVIVRNPLPVRVAVAVSIDGLNSIDGKRTSPRNARKWMIAPNSSITISGWQTSKQTLRKFLFTEQSATFAQWREDKDGKRFTKNLGVIGVAWFWNSDELEMALHPPQAQPFVEEEAPGEAYAPQSKRAMAAGVRAAPAPSMKAEERAGTGMGSQQQNRVTEVQFNANAGMYAVRDVLKIFYEFAQDPTEPLPFVDDDEDEGRFTADMYK